jgi:hypothetical protein
MTFDNFVDWIELKFIHTFSYDILHECCFLSKFKNFKTNLNYHIKYEILNSGYNWFDTY